MSVCLGHFIREMLGTRSKAPLHLPIHGSRQTVRAYCSGSVDGRRFLCHHPKLSDGVKRRLTGGEGPDTNRNVRRILGTETAADVCKNRFKSGTILRSLWRIAAKSGSENHYKTMPRTPKETRIEMFSYLHGHHHINLLQMAISLLNFIA